MQAGKRCVHCSEINEPGRSYCVRCGKYLTGRAKEQPAASTVWETEAFGAPDPFEAPAALQEDGSGPSLGTSVVCPECGEETLITDGILPPACIRCGYPFQAGLSGTGTAPAAPPASAVPPPKKSPMARAPRDTSSMRLFLLSRPGAMPETVGEQGGILGENGTVFGRLLTGQQISLWHTPSGWYAMTVKGQPLYNGVPQNAGRQIRLFDGDLIIMDREQIRVEIL